MSINLKDSPWNPFAWLRMRSFFRWAIWRATGIQLLLLLACLAVSIETRAQTDVVSSFNAVLNATCTNVNTACSGAVTPNPGQIGSTGSTLDEPTGYFNSSTITVSGTYSGATINFEFSDASGGGGVNYFSEICARTDINLLEASEALPTNQVRAWNCPAWAINRLRVRLSALSTGAVNVTMTMSTVAVDPSLVVAASQTNIAGASDPCLDVSALKNSTFQTITTATTTALVAVNGTTSVYTCGFQIVSSSTTTANTFLLEYGSGSTCATSPTALTPTWSVLAAPATPFVMNYGPFGTVLKGTPAGTGVCVVSTVGSTPTIQVLYTYVQQ